MAIMTTRGEKALFTALLLAAVAAVFAATLPLGRVARLVPLVVTIPTLALLVFQFALDAWPRLAERYARVEAKDLFKVEPLRSKSRAAAPEAADARRRRRESNAFTWLALIVPMIYLLGFQIALPAYAAVYLKTRSGAGWLVSSAGAAGLYALVHGVLGLALGVRLHEGELWRWLGL